MQNEQELETLRFMFDKRLELFNVRRDHEWKIFFGVMGLIGAVVVGLVTQRVVLPRDAIHDWWGVLAILFICSFYYQLEVQRRNRVDRAIMDELQGRLCDAVGIPAGSRIRTRVDREKLEVSPPWEPLKLHHPTYVWAFTAQHFLLLVTCVVAAILPDWFAPAAQSRPEPDGYLLLRPRVAVGDSRQALVERWGSPDGTRLFRDGRDTILEYRARAGRVLLTVRGGRVAGIREDSAGAAPPRAQE